MSIRKGFTLIELLVVIAIIGILSAVVLASLSTARTKSKDASVQTSMNSMRTAAELYAGSHSNKYQSGSAAITTCNDANSMFVDSSTGSNMKGLIDAVSAATKTTTAYDGMGCGITSSGNDWAVWAKLPSAPATGATATNYFCVDSLGKSGAPSSVPSGSKTVCP
jgi:prepilin-type N-terminal cleavage/methylation domain-containing protein